MLIAVLLQLQLTISGYRQTVLWCFLLLRWFLGSMESATAEKPLLWQKKIHQKYWWDRRGVNVLSGLLDLLWQKVVSQPEGR